jgi:hypothetical protein
MAGLAFGTSTWDDIPNALDMQVRSGVLMGTWNDLPVHAYFDNPYDRTNESYYHATHLYAELDPPLLLGRGAIRGLDPEHRRRVLDESLLDELVTRTKSAGPFSDCGVYVASETVGGTWYRHEGDAAKYRVGFDALTSAAKVILARRAADPAAWEIAVRSEWPPVASGWNLSLDSRRAQLEGTVRGRRVLVRAAIVEDLFTTTVRIALGLPEGCTVSLAPQHGDGFFKRLFRGQDVILGDAPFDAAFVVKGEPETFVRAAVGPAMRAQLVTLATSGCTVSLDKGVLEVCAAGFTATAAQLDELMKRTFAAIDAFGVA